jgi:hypothetical protein
MILRLDNPRGYSVEQNQAFLNFSLLEPCLKTSQVNSALMFGRCNDGTPPRRAVSDQECLAPSKPKLDQNPVITAPLEPDGYVFERARVPNTVLRSRNTMNLRVWLVTDRYNNVRTLQKPGGFVCGSVLIWIASCPLRRIDQRCQFSWVGVGTGRLHRSTLKVIALRCRTA